MGATRLGIYNGALGHCGERQLGSLTENREPRRLCDAAWDAGLVRYCLEQGQWKFAMRAVQIEAALDIEPAWGWRYAFDKSDDWVRTSAVSDSEYFNEPYLHYADEHGLICAEIDRVWVRFVSDAPEFGSDLSRWPATFTAWVEAYLAWRISPRIAAADPDKLEKMQMRQLIDAQSKDAMQGPTTFAPRGRWAMARAGGRSRHDRGSTSRLIG